MKAEWRRDAVDAQQLVLPSVTGLLLVVGFLSAVSVPSPYGFIICGALLTLLALLLRQNGRRRREGIDGWPNAVIVGPYVAITLVVLAGALVSELLAAVVAVSLVAAGLVLLIRRLRRPAEPGRPAHHFRGASSQDDA
jgi:hypothetical protein